MSRARIEPDQYGDIDELFKRVEALERRNSTMALTQQPAGGFKTPFIRSSSGGGVTSNTQATVPFPSPLVEGDLIVGLLTVNSSSSGVIASANQGVAVAQQLDAPTSVRTHLFWKKATAADIGASLTVGWPNLGPIGVAMVAIGNADWRHSVVDFFEAAGIASTSAPNYAMPQARTRVDNELILYMVGHGNGTVLSAPAPLTTVVQGRGALGNSDRTSAIFTEVQAAATAATPARTITDPNAGGFTPDAAEVYTVAIRGIPANIAQADLDVMNTIPPNHRLGAQGGGDVALPNTSAEIDFATNNGARFYLVVATGAQQEEWEFISEMLVRADSANDSRVRSRQQIATGLQNIGVQGGGGTDIAYAQAQRLYLSTGPLAGWTSLVAAGRAILLPNTTYLSGVTMSAQGGSFGGAYYRGADSYVHLRAERKG
jgi:hypothetical protein